MHDFFCHGSSVIRILRSLGGSALVAATLGLIGCDIIGGPSVRGSGVAKAETREVGAFTRVESAGSANVAIQIGDKQSVIIETDDNILPLIDTLVKGDRLVISSHGRYSTRIGVKVTIVVPALNEARISGSGNITASGVSAKEFDAHISGSGDIHISGSTDSLKASIAGSGGIDASKLPVTAADVSISGSGNIKLLAPQSLHASISGSGDVRCASRPKQIKTRVSGSGKVRWPRDGGARM